MELLQPGRPYPHFLRFLAKNGYYGEGDIDPLVARRMESLRDPSGKSFEDHTPDGRWYRILRRRTSAGWIVMVIPLGSPSRNRLNRVWRKEVQLSNRARQGRLERLCTRTKT